MRELAVSRTNRCWNSSHRLLHKCVVSQITETQRKYLSLFRSVNSNHQKNFWLEKKILKGEGPIFSHGAFDCLLGRGAREGLLYIWIYFQGLGGGGSEPRSPLDPCMYFSSFDSLFVRRCYTKTTFFCKVCLII